MKRSILTIVFFGFSVIFCFAQKTNNTQSTNTKPPLDGVYEHNQIINRDPIPWTSLIKKDVMWEKMIIRQVDMRQKINLPLYYPADPLKGRISFMQVILNGIKEGSITAYDGSSEEFLSPYSVSKFDSTFNRIDSTDQFDSTGQVVGKVAVSKKLEARDIKQFRIKEYWFFDKQRSVMDVRIVGIQPLKAETRPGVEGEEEEEAFRPLFWVYFPEFRNLLAKNPVFNVWNDAEVKSFDDIFWKRMFASYITKESNVYDRVIKSYAKDLDALLEAEKIHDYIFNYEQDLWEY